MPNFDHLPKAEQRIYEGATRKGGTWNLAATALVFVLAVGGSTWLRSLDLTELAFAVLDLALFALFLAFWMHQRSTASLVRRLVRMPAPSPSLTPELSADVHSN